MLYQIQLEESGSGRLFNLTEDCVTLEKANEIVQELSLRWEEWMAHGFPELVDPDDVLGSYEGCDIIAVGEDGKTCKMLEDDDVWVDW